jgi:hypothetical protein
MNFENLFKIEPQITISMNQVEFVEKTRLVLTKIAEIYVQGWQNRRLQDNEIPSDDVCNKCTGCGVFKENGEERDCVQQDEEFTDFSL